MSFPLLGRGTAWKGCLQHTLEHLYVGWFEDGSALRLLLESHAFVSWLNRIRQDKCGERRLVALPS